MNGIDPDAVRVGLLAAVMLVASIDVSVAFLMRGGDEASKEHNRD